jgi:regulator of protease activity HflC (stomatin/prohibitin superfamily)
MAQNQQQVPLIEVAAPGQQAMDLGPSAPSGAAARTALNDDTLMTAQEQSPAYRALHAQNLIASQFRVRRIEDLNVIPSNSDVSRKAIEQCLTMNGCCCLVQFFTVQSGCVRKGTHSNGQYMFFGEGPHVIHSPYVSVESQDVALTSELIVHGTRAIITVAQGFVGLATDRGQPVLLPPGLHQWESNTLKFERLIDLATSVIYLGPYTLVTVDEGYAGVTSDNGEQKVLDGGSAYMLTHRNWKFEKFITKKLQTNDVGPLTVTSGDNVPLRVAATVSWRIEDVIKAARMAANTMQQMAMAPGGIPSASAEFDISKLREDVMRQVTASLAAFVGTIQYSASGGGHAAMARRVHGDGDGVAASKSGKFVAEPEPEEEKGGAKALFDRDQLMGSVEHANEICGQYGVRILAINLVSAYPSDGALLAALSQGAVATVAAEQCEIEARGQAAAMLAKAKAEAESARIRAEGDAAAEEARAEGSLNAARKLEASEVAVMVAKMRAAGAALSEGKANSFFFGLSGAGDLPNGVLGATMANSLVTKHSG